MSLNLTNSWLPELTLSCLHVWILLCEFCMFVANDIVDKGTSVYYTKKLINNCLSCVPFKSTTLPLPWCGLLAHRASVCIVLNSMGFHDMLMFTALNFMILHISLVGIGLNLIVCYARLVSTYYMSYSSMLDKCMPYLITWYFLLGQWVTIDSIVSDTRLTD